MIDPRIEPANPFTEAELAKIAEAVGRTLPDEFRGFAMGYGGAFVGGLVDEDAELPILAFFDAASVLSKLEAHADLKDEGGLPIADCELGNLYVIDRENAVYYINYYGGQTTSRKVAAGFNELLRRIVVSNE